MNLPILGALLTTMGSSFVVGLYYHQNHYIVALPIAIAAVLIFSAE